MTPFTDFSKEIESKLNGLLPTKLVSKDASLSEVVDALNIAKAEIGLLSTMVTALNRVVAKQQKEIISLKKQVARYPSDLLKDILEERGMTCEEFSKETGIHTSTLLEILAGTRPIITALGQRLAKVTRISLQEWFDAQDRYDIDRKADTVRI